MITVTFNDFDEMCKQVLFLADLFRKDPKASATKVVETMKKAAEPEPKQEEPKAEQEAPKITEDFRVEVRKLLAKVNKQTGTNTASDMIKEITGKDKLTQVPLEMLPELKKRAEEVLNAG